MYKLGKLDSSREITLSFHPQVNQELAIGDILYRITEHPAAPGIPYGQEGRQAIVYQLAAPSPDAGEGRGGAVSAGLVRHVRGRPLHLTESGFHRGRALRTERRDARRLR